MNRIIRQISLVGLLILAGAIGVNAQASQQYRADIPFSFEANGKHYEAGEYSVGSLSAPGAIAIRNLDSGKMSVLGINSRPGDNRWDDPGRLTFLKVDGRYTLSQISTATFKMKMKVQKSRELAKGTADSAIVAVDLK